MPFQKILYDIKSYGIFRYLVTKNPLEFLL